jgi:hypothetical protein
LTSRSLAAILNKYRVFVVNLQHLVKGREQMEKQRFNPERDLRAWADALNAVADLQVAIVEQAQDMTMLDREGIEWLEPFRAIVLRTLRMFPDIRLANHLEEATTLKQTATEAIARLQEEAPQYRKEVTL